MRLGLFRQKGRRKPCFFCLFRPPFLSPHPFCHRFLRNRFTVLDLWIYFYIKNTGLQSLNFRSNFWRPGQCTVFFLFNFYSYHLLAIRQIPHSPGVSLYCQSKDDSLVLRWINPMVIRVVHIRTVNITEDVSLHLQGDIISITIFCVDFHLFPLS